MLLSDTEVSEREAIRPQTPLNIKMIESHLYQKQRYVLAEEARLRFKNKTKHNSDLSTEPLCKKRRQQQAM